MNILPLPEICDSKKAYNADYCVRNISRLQKYAEEWKKKNNILNSVEDKKKIHLLVIDDQYDFTYPEGALFVAGRSGKGAMEAQEKLVNFIYRYLHKITKITCTMDSHFPLQIFFPAAHLREDGSHPEAHTVISASDYAKGIYRANPGMADVLKVDPGWLNNQFRFYCEELERKGKYSLYLWPYHCLLGSNGHRLSGPVEEACLFHSFAREVDFRPVIKGDNPLTEHYSVFSPETDTCWDGSERFRVNTSGLMKSLFDSEAVLIAGLASSHCVKESINDLVAEIKKTNPELAGKFYILRDCMAPVVIPGGPDFTGEAERALNNFQDFGMNVVDSENPILF
ncbi:MAG: nicotinamidase [Candidatus Riflebacteria bacterium]|nr:nicotinamidase [Candidatus Riflebacteria bacterium]